MRVDPGTRWRMGEQRRYFPDWTARLLERGVELEADHNSYLAGGYAEEFGYRAQPGYSRGVPLLDGESPEQSAEWLIQARATHPGYPIRSHPLDVDFAWGAGEWKVSGAATNLGRSPERPIHRARDAEPHGAFVVVSNRRAERRREAAQIGSAAAMRLAAALDSLRWMLRRWH